MPNSALEVCLQLLCGHSVVCCMRALWYILQPLRVLHGYTSASQELLSPSQGRIVCRRTVAMHQAQTEMTQSARVLHAPMIPSSKGSAQSQKRWRVCRPGPCRPTWPPCALLDPAELVPAAQYVPVSHASCLV